MPSFAYGTPATTLPFNDSDDLQKPVVNGILPKKEITSKSPRAVVLRTARYGGIWIDHLTEEQRSHGQLQYLLGHLQFQDTTGHRIHGMMEFSHMECGFTGNVLEQSYNQYARASINENWITAVWAHLERYEATLKVTGLLKSTHGKDKDGAIMETSTASGMFKQANI
jgi:hypothetical protein